MSDKGIWSDHLVRKFVRDNAFKPLVVDEAYSTRESSPGGLPPTVSYFQGKGTIVFPDKGGNYRGGALVTYGSLVPSLLFKNIQPEVWLYNPKKTDEIVSELARRYGVALDPTWFISKDFDYTTMPQTIRLDVKRTNFTVQDYFSVTIRRADARLDEIFTDNVLEGPKVSFTTLAEKTCAEFSYSKDCTPDNLALYKEVKRYPSGVITDVSQYSDKALQVVADLIKERLGWTTQYEKEFGLHAGDLCFRGSELIYNGPSKQYVHPVNDPSSPTADTWYDNVLVIRFDPVYSGVHGMGYFHYNDLSS